MRKKGHLREKKIHLFNVFKQNDITFTVAAVRTFIFSGFGWQHCDLGARLLDELLQVNLPQLLRQLLQLVLHVLQSNSMRERFFRKHRGITCILKLTKYLQVNIVRNLCICSPETSNHNSNLQGLYLSYYPTG